MHQLTSGIIGGIIGLSAMGLFVPEINGARFLTASARDGSISLHNVDRGAKGDRLSRTAPLVTGGPEIVTTEALGGVSVVYRDRVGRVISRVDQASGMTYVAKTESFGNSTEQKGPALPSRTNERMPNSVADGRLPDGCESAVSVTADPELARRASRCVS